MTDGLNEHELNEHELNVAGVAEAISTLDTIQNGSLDELREIVYLQFGLCYVLRPWVPYSYLHEVFKSWEYYTGSDEYPVPPTKVHQLTDTELKVAAGTLYFSSDNKYEGEYGELRRDLARHIREDLEVQLTTLKNP